MIEDGETGHLVNEKDVDAIANKLLYLIEHPETWSLLGKKARTKIENDFNLQIQTDKLEQLFDQVIHTHEKKITDSLSSASLFQPIIVNDLLKKL